MNVTLAILNLLLYQVVMILCIEEIELESQESSLISEENSGSYDSSELDAILNDPNGKGRFLNQIKQMIQYFTNTKASPEEMPRHDQSVQYLQLKLNQTIKDKNSCVRELMSAQEQIEDIIEQFKEYKRRNSYSDSEMKKIKKDMKMLEKFKLDADKKIRSLEKEALTLGKTKGVLEKRLLSIEKENIDLEKMRSNLDKQLKLLEREKSEIRKNIEILEIKAEKLETENEELSSTRSGLEKKVLNLERENGVLKKSKLKLEEDVIYFESEITHLKDALRIKDDGRGVGSKKPVAEKCNDLQTTIKMLEEQVNDLRRENIKLRSEAKKDKDKYNMAPSNVNNYVTHKSVSYSDYSASDEDNNENPSVHAYVVV